MSNKLKTILITFALFFSIAVISITVYLVNKSKEEAKKVGASQSVSVVFSPNEILSDLNTVLNPIIQIDPSGNQVSAIELYISYDKDLIDIQKVDILPEAFARTLKDVEVDANAGKISVILGVEPVDPITTKTDFISLYIKTKNKYGQAKISVDQSSRVAALGVDENVLTGLGEMVINVPDPTATSTPTAEPTTTTVATATSLADLTATSTPTAEPTTTPTSAPAEPNSCGGTCGSNFNCKANLYCYEGYCRNPICKNETDCDCSSVVATSTPTVIATSPSTITKGGSNYEYLDDNSVTMDTSGVSGSSTGYSAGVSSDQVSTYKPTFVSDFGDNTDNQQTSKNKNSNLNKSKPNVFMYVLPISAFIIVVFIIYRIYKVKKQDPTIIPPTNL